MAPPAATAHVVYSGTLETSEEFAFGYWNLVPGITTAAGFAQSFGALVDAQATQLATLMGIVADSATRITAVDGYYYSGGSTKSSFVGHEDVSIAGSGTASLPPQVACCVSLLTGLPGRSRRGRSYLPYTKVTNLGNTPVQITQAVTAQIASSFAAVLNRGPAVGWQPVVVSDMLALSTVVDSVRVDSKLDTMRSRARNFNALYSAASPVNNT